MSEILTRVEKYLLYGIVFLFPITLLSISSNPFVVPKLALLSFGVAFLLLIRALRVILSGRLDFFSGNFDFPVLLIAIAYLASALLRTPNKMEAFLLPGVATAVIAGALLYFLTNQLKETDKATLSTLVFASAAIFSLFTLLSASGVFEKIPQLPAYIRATGFTPEGGYLPAVIFLGITLPLAIGQILSEKISSRKVLWGAALTVVVFAFALSLYNLFPGRPTAVRFPSLGVSWYVAVDSLKESPILGVGAGNYTTAFNRFRPLTYNQSDLWAIKFGTARNFYLTALTESGMLALSGFVLLLVNVYTMAKKDFKEKRLVNWGFAASANLFSLLLLALILFFAPATILLIVYLFLLLSLNAKIKHTSLSLTTQGVENETQNLTTQRVASRFPALLITVPVIICVVIFLFRASRVLAAEYKFKSALDSLAANDATQTYDTMREAIRINPKVDRYHSTFARVNLALANAIAQKEDISEGDRQNITLLVQQAINEGKATVALNPLRSGNWEVLAQIYRAIMPLAKGADSFAIQTYRQAVALDPFNPNLRIALGGVHYTLKDYEGAIRIFESAVAAKNDHPNAHYNLAFALRENKQIDRAISEMSIVVAQLPTSSPDREVARKALEDMQTKKSEAAATGKELTPPQGEEGPTLQPPVELPEGSEPPVAPITPIITPIPTESAGQISPTTTPTPLP